MAQLCSKTTGAGAQPPGKDPNIDTIHKPVTGFANIGQNLV
jgi:hypothetical protein